jgi:protein-S-isoprenylcysteine O-methyltransferase Ste14
MWIYIILAAVWGSIIFGWLIPVIRKRIICEIYEACGLGGFFTLIILGLGGVWAQFNIVPLRIIGLVLYIPAAFFVVSAFIALRRKGEPETGWENSTTMIQSSVFRIVRHPLYLGTAIWTVGLMLIFQSIPLTILGVVNVFCFWMASKKEDAFNIEKFGDGYKEYMKKVPMWNAFKRLRKR